MGCGMDYELGASSSAAYKSGFNTETIFIKHTGNLVKTLPAHETLNRSFNRGSTNAAQSSGQTKLHLPSCQLSYFYILSPPILDARNPSG